MGQSADLFALIYILGSFVLGIAILALARRRESRSSGTLAAVRSVDPLEQAELYLARGWRAEAIATLEQAIERDPGREDVRRTLAQLESRVPAISAD